MDEVVVAQSDDSDIHDVNDASHGAASLSESDCHEDTVQPHTPCTDHSDDDDDDTSVSSQSGPSSCPRTHHAALPHAPPRPTRDACRRRRTARPSAPSSGDTPFFHIADAPTYRKVAHRSEHHGHVREDPYFWLRSKSSARVKRLLHRENDHVERFFQSHDPHLRRRLFAQMRARYKEDDASLPVRDRHYWYYCRHVRNEEHALYCRRPYDADAGINVDFDHVVSALWRDDPQAVLPAYDDEAVYLDLNLLRHTLRLDFIELGELAISPDESQLAVTLDCSEGREVFTLFVMRIRDVRYDDWVQHGASSVHRAWAEQRIHAGASIYGSPTAPSPPRRTRRSGDLAAAVKTITTTRAMSSCGSSPPRHAIRHRIDHAPSPVR